MNTLRSIKHRFCQIWNTAREVKLKTKTFSKIRPRSLPEKIIQKGTTLCEKLVHLKNGT